MKCIFIVAVGLLLIAGPCTSYEKREASNYLVVIDDETSSNADSTAEDYDKVVKFYANSVRSAIVGGSHMQSAAGYYTDTLFITYKNHDNGGDVTYEFIKDGEIVHQEEDDFLSVNVIDDLVESYLN